MPNIKLRVLEVPNWVGPVDVEQALLKISQITQKTGIHVQNVYPNGMIVEFEGEAEDIQKLLDQEWLIDILP